MLTLSTGLVQLPRNPSPPSGRDWEVALSCVIIPFLSAVVISEIGSEAHGHGDMGWGPAVQLAHTLPLWPALGSWEEFLTV